ncbi:MAG TPA: glycosyltransferase [Acidobacteriota bacterium]|nr:glycosyltransferase [Acidobacteriota bacterium]
MLSIVIPTWNGLHLLRENLPSVLRAAEFFQRRNARPWEIIVVDDGGEDETPQALPLEFPQVELIRRPVNGGFSPACNSGFEHCRYPLVALLNNDVQVEDDYFVHLASHFTDSSADEDLFAVTARVFEWDEPVFATGGKVGRFRRGFWSVYFNYDLDGGSAARRWTRQRRLLSFYAVGGFAAYRRDKLMELGGFLEILAPFHWEDIDLSYRAWKRGWQVRYEPRSLARHRTSATIDSHFKRQQVEEASLRNRLLFHWINCHRPAWMAAHLMMLTVKLLTRILAGDVGFYRALWKALGRLGEVRRLRRTERLAARRSDEQVADLLTAFYEKAPIAIYYNRSQVVSRHPGPERETDSAPREAS